MRWFSYRARAPEPQDVQSAAPPRSQVYPRPRVAMVETLESREYLSAAPIEMGLLHDGGAWTHLAFGPLLMFRCRPSHRRRGCLGVSCSRMK